MLIDAILLKQYEEIIYKLKIILNQIEVDRQELNHRVLFL